MLFEYERLLSLAHRADRRGTMESATVSATATNASCGDECAVWVKMIDDVIIEISFEAKGCVISQASAAVHVEMLAGIAGKKELLERVENMTGQELPMYTNLSISPLRQRCLTTSLVALHDAISKL